MTTEENGQDVMKDANIQCQVTTDSLSTSGNEWREDEEMRDVARLVISATKAEKKVKHVQSETIIRPSPPPPWPKDANLPEEQQSKISTEKKKKAKRVRSGATALSPHSNNFSENNDVSQRKMERVNLQSHHRNVPSESTTEFETLIELSSSPLQTCIQKGGEREEVMTKRAVFTRLHSSPCQDSVDHWQEDIDVPDELMHFEKQSSTELLSTSPDHDARNEMDMKEQMSIQSAAVRCTKEPQSTLPDEMEQQLDIEVSDAMLDTEKQSIVDSEVSEITTEPLLASSDAQNEMDTKYREQPPYTVKADFHTDSDISPKKRSVQFRATVRKYYLLEETESEKSETIRSEAFTDDSQIDDWQVESDVPDDTQETMIDTVKQRSVERVDSEAITEPLSATGHAQDEMDMEEWMRVPPYIVVEPPSLRTSPDVQDEMEMEERMSIHSETTMADVPVGETETILSDRLLSDNSLHDKQIENDDPDDSQEAVLDTEAEQCGVRYDSESTTESN